MSFAGVPTYSRGFTLIELVMVIVILGVLAAVALPRFADLSDSARISQAQGIAGAYQSAVQLVKLVFNSQGHSTRVQNLPNFGDGTIDTNNLGFPIGTNKGTGNENIGQGAAGCTSLWNGLLESPPGVSTAAGQEYQSYRHDGNRVCSYVYRAGGDTAGRVQAQIVIRYDSRNGQVDVCGRHPDLPNC